MMAGTPAIGVVVFLTRRRFGVFMTGAAPPPGGVGTGVGFGVGFGFDVGLGVLGGLGAGPLEPPPCPYSQSVKPMPRPIPEACVGIEVPYRSLSSHGIWRLVLAGAQPWHVPVHVSPSMSAGVLRHGTRTQCHR